MTSLTEKSFEEADKSASSNTLVNTLADDLMCLGTALTSVRGAFGPGLTTELGAECDSLNRPSLRPLSAN